MILGLIRNHKTNLRDAQLKKDSDFKWNNERRKWAFHQIKEAIASAPLFISPDYLKEFQIFSFASEDTIAGVLLQKNEQGLAHSIYEQKPDRS